VNPLAQTLAAEIAADGPITIAEFMARALYDPQHGYYITRDPLGRGGDFTTAPEISPLFGELVGLWCVQTWMEMGEPEAFALIELGPGRGTLMADIVRAARIRPGFLKAAKVCLVEVNPVLRTAQHGALAAFGVEVRWFESLEAVPTDPSIIVGNEFLDCLPIRQFIRTNGAWREKLVGLDATSQLAFGLSQPVPPPPLGPDLPAAADGTQIEIAPGLAAFTESLSARFGANTGRALFIDYGGDGLGDTLQALSNHTKVSPIEAPGEADLTAHVNFNALAKHAKHSGLTVAGPMPQGAWLNALGIQTRARAVISANPQRGNVTAGELARLVDDDQMGNLFQAIALSSSGLPPAAGFPL
jgi:NADH dehydrogenase [ubiquinone] 1 alpha subcomplex assembly factor 7